MNFTEDGNETYIRASLIRRKADEPKFDVIELQIASESIQPSLKIRFAPEEALEVISALSCAVRKWLTEAPLYQAYREWKGTEKTHAAARKAFES